MSNISSHIKLCRVSSVLNKDTKNYGKQYIYDGNEDTCWNSDKGSPQWINFEFNEFISLDTLKIQFQGGFVGSQCEIKFKLEDNEVISENIYPEDNNLLQSFLFNQIHTTNNITLSFAKSTDFFGRIVVYNVLFT